ncbi:hypothetical protein HA402_015267 [Bradysia odoriphaga]|nr:hypothetical protein HA402_015267 [Bradysia odoriphaga]
MKLSGDDGTISSDAHKLKSRSVPSEDLDQKLEALATLLASTRAAVARVEKGVAQLQGNFTHLQASTKTIHHFQRHIPTKQFLNNILQNARSQLISSNNDDTIASSCHDIEDPQTGIYQIQLHNGMKPFYVRCEETSEDKWTVILNRFNGATSFYRNWVEYKNGFGNIATEFWIGLDKLYEITNSKLHELYIVLEDFDGVIKHARYSQFSIGSEKEGYPLNVLGEYSGTAGDSLSYHAGSKFSTFDVDNDVWLEGNCAQSHTGGWWYNSCDTSNLNGKYFNGTVSELARFQGIYWNDFHGPTYSLRAVKMLIKAIQYQ